MHELPSLIEQLAPPALSEPHLRLFRDQRDFDHMAAIISGCKQADSFERSVTGDMLAHFYTHEPYWNGERDIVYAECAERTIGFATCFWQPPEDGEQVFSHLGFVLPDLRQRGIGAALLAWVEQRARQIAAGQPAGCTRWLEANASAGERAKHALLQASGYAPARYHHLMRRPLTAPIAVPALPRGLMLRPAHPDDYQAILAASNEAFRDHWGNLTASWEEFSAWIAHPDTDVSLWHIAWDGEQVAGMVLAEIPRAENLEYCRMRGYLTNVCVRRPWRGRGLARALMLHTLRALRMRALSEVLLEVDTENALGALRLYESLGFTPVKINTTYRKPLNKH